MMKIKIKTCDSCPLNHLRRCTHPAAPLLFNIRDDAEYADGRYGATALPKRCPLKEENVVLEPGP